MTIKKASQGLGFHAKGVYLQPTKNIYQKKVAF